MEYPSQLQGQEHASLFAPLLDDYIDRIRRLNMTGKRYKGNEKSSFSMRSEEVSGIELLCTRQSGLRPRQAKKNRADLLCQSCQFPSEDFD
jgi:hypothetical protein